MSGLLLFFLLTACTGEHSTKKNEFHMNLNGEPSTLNPLTASDGYSNSVQRLVLDTLLTRDLDTFEWKPAVAESYKISPDGLTFTFKLRPGLVFSDGSPLTSADVKATFDAYFDPEQNAAHMRPNFELFEKVETPDPLTVIFKVKEKYFLNFEHAALIDILPAKYYKDPKSAKKLSLNIYGSGPYKLESFERGKEIVLTKNEKWWGYRPEARSPEYNFDRIHLYFVDDETIALENFKRGRFDMLNPSPQTFELKLVGPDWGTKFIKVKAQNKTNSGYNYIGWNLRDPKFKDKRVRRALAYLLDRKLIIDKFFYGMRVEANGPIAVGRDDNDAGVAPIPFDIEKAKALLKEAGWRDSDKDGILDKTIDGKKVSLKITLLNASPSFEKFLTIFKEDALKAGVEIDIRSIEWNSLLKLLADKKYEAVALSWGAGNSDFDFKAIWHSESMQNGGFNDISYSNPLVDNLIEKQRRTLDRNERLKLSHQIFRIIADDAPYLFMFCNKYELYAHSARIWKPKDTFNYGIGNNYWKIKE